MQRSREVSGTIDTCQTHCPYCALQCGMSLTPEGPSLTVGSRDFPTNRGGLCRKGWTSTELLRHPERLDSPLLRRAKGEPLQPVSWDEAFDWTAQEIQRLQSAYG